jgi:hypothetical protein
MLFQILDLLLGTRAPSPAPRRRCEVRDPVELRLTTIAGGGTRVPSDTASLDPRRVSTEG